MWFYMKKQKGEKSSYISAVKVWFHDQRAASTTKAIDFPVFVEYYLNSGFLLISAKPRSNLYVYEEGKGFYSSDNTFPPTITTEKIISQTYDRIVKLFGIEKADRSNEFRRRIFLLLDKFTKTPAEIKAAIDAQQDLIGQISETIKRICGVPQSMDKDVADDIYNTVEKYFSINWEEAFAFAEATSVFTKDRDAYPVKLKATDEEDSKVEQTAAEQLPLQTRAVFFDNKKMLQKNRACDGILLRWKRTATEDGYGKHFNVRISAIKGPCIFKFTEYTSKEDIDNVVFSIINHEGIDGTAANNN